MLRRECQVMEIERDLDDKVNAQMDKGQREYYLREQMHIISEELGDAGTIPTPKPIHTAEDPGAAPGRGHPPKSCSRSATAWPGCRAVRQRAA